MALLGLFWLSKDFEGIDSPIEPEAKEIAIMRNFMEHKSFKIVEGKNICWDEVTRNRMKLKGLIFMIKHLRF